MDGVQYTGCLVLLSLHRRNQKDYRAHQKLISKLISIQIDLTWSWEDTDKNLWVNQRMTERGHIHTNSHLDTSLITV